MTETSPLVSVIVPVHNGEKTVAAAIASVLSGSHENVQIVVCDDASTDRTADLVQDINDSRITLLRNSDNIGPGLSRDKAIDASDGKWLTFLDADDAWTPRRLANLLGASRDDHAVMVFDDIMLCHQNSEGMKPWQRVYGAHAFGARNGDAIDVPPALWAASSQFVMQPLIHTATIRANGVRHSGRRFQEDTEFFLRLISAGMKLRYVPSADYLYRITPGSLSSADRPGARTREMLEETLSLFVNDREMRSVLKKKITYRYFTAALRSGNVRKAVRYAGVDPGFMAEFAWRTLEVVRYHVSRIAHGAPKR